MQNWYKIVLILSLVVIAGSNFYSALYRTGTSIAVTGQSSVKVIPGEFTLIATRATLADTPTDAVAQGEVAMTRITDVVKKIAGADTDVKKSYFQLTPQTDGKFLMANAISIKSTNVGVVGNLIKLLYTNGATTISNVSFSPNDNGVSEKKSREEAIADAKKKADDMASSMGKRVGRVMSIGEDNVGLSGALGDSFSSSSTVGTINMEKRVSVVYEIN